MTLDQAFRDAEALLTSDARAALAALVPIADATPEFAPARFRIVDALLTLGEVEAATRFLKAQALSFARQGMPVQAMLACKLIESMGKDSDATASEIALIYAGLTGHELLPTAAPPTLPNAVAPAPVTGDVIAAAERVAKVETPLPARFGAVPLFSRLSAEDFVIVLRALKLHRVGDKARLITQGAAGNSCFLLADGIVAVARGEQRLATLYPGTIFGEMALVSRRPRNASVTSIGGATVLELNKATLLAHGPAMRDALYAFTRRRLLENIAASSPLFQPLDAAARLDMLGRFGSLPMRVGTPLINEGEPGHGVFVVLRGSVRVERRGTDLATLYEGDLFGEISVLRDTPTTASVLGAEEGEVLFLDKGEFRAVVSRYPQVQAALSSLTEDRLRAAEMLI